MENIVDRLRAKVNEAGNTDSDKLKDEIRFDIEQLHDSKFKELIKYLNNENAAPVEYLITATLAALSGAIGKNVRYELSNRMQLYLNIWAVIIGKSSVMKKTTAINTACYELHQIQKKYNDDYKIKLANADSKEKTNIKREYICLPHDSTIESFTGILQDTSRGLVEQPEFAAYLSLFDRSYNQGAKQFLTNIYDVPRDYVTTRKTTGSTSLERPYFAFIAASTIDWIIDKLSDTDISAGFFPRHLFCIRNVNDKPFIGLLELKNRNRNETNNILNLYNELIEIEPDRILDCDNEASIEFKKFELNIYNYTNNSTDNKINAFYTRLSTYALKIAGIIALTNDPNTSIVNINAMKDALLLIEYYKLNVDRLLDVELQTNKFKKQENRIIELIKRHGETGKIKHSDLLKNSRMPKKDFEVIIETMISSEILISQEVMGNTKSVRWYCIK